MSLFTPRKVTAVTLAVLMLASAGAVLADTVVSDSDVLTAGDQNLRDLGNVGAGVTLTPQVSFTLACGGSKHLDNGQTLNITFSSGSAGVSGATGASVTAPSTWPDDASGAPNCGVTPPAPLSDNGNSTVTIVTPLVGGTYTVNVFYSTSFSPAGANDLTSITGANPSASFRFTVIADSTAPGVSFSQSPDGNNGWFKTAPATVTVTATDADSNISSIDCTLDSSPVSLSNTTGIGTAMTASGDISTSTDGNHAVSCTATDAASNTTSPAATTSLKLDTVDPGITFDGQTPAANANGWNNSAVQLDWTCTDATSGPVNPGDTETLSGEGADQQATGNCEDNAGNTSSDTQTDIDIDLTDPTTSVTGVTEGATYVLGSVPTAGCDDDDNLSGIQTASSLSSVGGPVGSITVTCSAPVDNADNTGDPASVTYNVIYNWSGFFSPVDNPQVYNGAKAGQSIPVKFSLGGNQGLSILASGFPTSKTVTCDSVTSTDAIEVYATDATNNKLIYDATADQYNYVWQTQKSWAGTCRQLTVKLVDGTIHQALFKFK